MAYFAVKTLITAVVVVTVSEISKRSSLLGALVASLPLTSLLAMIWLYIDTKNTEKVVALSYSIFWIVLPSIVFFLAFPLFIKLGLRFASALLAACVVMSISYGAYILVLRAFGVRL